MGLIFSRDTIIVIPSLVLLGASLTGLLIFFDRLFHDELPSRIRAGASSAINTLSRIFVIPISLLFGYVSQTSNVFNAAWILFASIILMIVVVILRTKNSSDKK